MKNLFPLLALLPFLQITSANASVIAIMDSGTDISHPDLSPKVFVNTKERLGSKKDLDKDGLPGDVYGWDFIDNTAYPFNNQYNSFITEDVKKFFNYYGLYELGKITKDSPEGKWLQAQFKNAEFMSKFNFIGGYIHGTHVAGIAAYNNLNAKLLCYKVIPTVYTPAPSAKPNSADKSSKKKDKAAMTAVQFKAELVKSANAQIVQMSQINSLLDFHKVDVVNQSFGIGTNDAAGFITSEFAGLFKRQPTKEELKGLLLAYFVPLLTDGKKMFDAAPRTLFTIAAGNDSLDNDLYPDFPAGILAENKIVVAATLGYSALADFSNFGARSVDVAAPGVAITSTAPTSTYISLSGTSQATPYVANIVAALKDINPALNFRGLKAIVLGTVDVKAWLSGKVLTSGIVNKARALKAAELSLSLPLETAIANAKNLVLDVPVSKSFFKKASGFTLNIKPIRPSLLLKKL